MSPLEHPLSVKHGEEEIKIGDQAEAEQLSTDLQNPETFRAFAQDPKGFAGKYGIQIDDTVSGRLHEALDKADSLGAFQQDEGEVSCTAVAVAMGAAAVSDTKAALVI